MSSSTRGIVTHHVIGELKLICEEKLAAYAEFKKRIGKLPVEQRQKATARLGRDFYQVSRLITYLEKVRKATVQYKFRIYDMGMAVSNCRQDDNYGKDKGFDYHYDNLLPLLQGYPDEEGQEFMDGMPAEIAGRIVIPMISCGLENPQEHFRRLDDKYTVQLERLSGALRKQQGVSVREVNRSKRFIAALNWVNDNVDMNSA